jgi:hypothetical protein
MKHFIASTHPARVVVLACAIALTLGWSPAAAQSDKTPPTTPTNLHITAITSYTVTLAWNPSTDNSGKFSYRICCANVSSETVSQSVTTHTYTAGLEAGRSFTLRIYAVDAAGNFSKPSNSVSFTLPADKTPPTTPVVSLTDVGPTHVSLAWSSTDDGPHVWYWVFMDGSPVIQGSSSNTGTKFLLEPESTHTFTVRARDFAMNWSPFSVPLTVTTEPVNPNDVTPPTMPQNLRANNIADLEIRVTWDQSTDDFDPQWIIRYDVEVNGVLSDSVVGQGRSFVYGEPGLNTVTVTAVDTAGNRSAPALTTVVIQ